MFSKILFFVLLAAIGVGTLSCGTSTTTTDTDTVSTPFDPIPDTVFSDSFFAQDTQIAYASGQYKNIQDFVLGDNIYCGNINLSWDVKRVYSATGVTAEQMLYLDLTSAESSTDKELIVSAQAFVLMSNGKLKYAEYLVPGDQVQGVDGTLYTVNIIRIGYYSGGLYAVGTNEKEGCYLIDVNGIVFSHYGLLPFD